MILILFYPRYPCINGTNIYILVLLFPFSFTFCKNYALITFHFPHHITYIENLLKGWVLHEYWKFSLTIFEKETQNVMHQDLEASEIISNFLLTHIPIKTNIPIILVCIGTDRSTGDALGPLVGTKLEQIDIQNLQVFGTLDEPVHALNLEEKIQNIQKENPTAFIIAVDACLGKSQNIGSITTGKGPSKPELL